ncbi:circadian clock protein KaiC [Tsuneonella deserti]|uniref:non-specific serine/threonine protein kinase n=1 Tax=Tsuneonella deserti TaxID=2035528 RepID=A0ABQ1RVR2_9SPHN|nr:ATPase domain-containing protein [Tsuneonella deserti]GGD84380.1 circadian clock protein KaiC [Tsuneonella deserti]
MEFSYLPTALIPTGVPGLDPILDGGYAENRVHLVEGQPGSGKTSMALQFLMDGARQGELGLYVTLSETKAELCAVAASHGWTFEGIEIFEMVPPELSLDPNAQQTVFYSSEVELGETVRMVMAEVERVKPKRLVFDSLSEIRLLSQGSLRYRRQVLALKHFFLKMGCTVLMLDDLTSEQDDLNLHSISHGVLRLEQLAALYGAERRRIRCIKMRGVKFRGGYHDFTIERGGLRVYPRLVAAEHHVDFAADVIGSGVAALDALVGGGLDRGTSTLIIGPSGSGKSSLSLQFVYAALQRGEPALVLVFDEVRSVFLRRAQGMGFELQPFLDQGLLHLRQIDPAELTPGELTACVRDSVEGHGVRVVVLDSLSGYLNAMPEEHFMMLQMHEMLSYLNQQGIVTILVLAQHGMVGHMASPVDLTYLSDSVIMLRFFESGGKLRRALSVLKKRTGHHEETIREYRISSHGVAVGEALTEFQGVLTGVPTYLGAESDLLEEAAGREG